VGDKGSGDFIPISWDAALEEISDRLRPIVTDQAGETILHAHYTGTCSLLAGEFPLRFFNRLGATEVDPDTICNNAGHVALEYVYGSSSTGFDPRSITDSRCLLVWGANPSACAPHVHKYWLEDRANKLIVIDPVGHATAQCADIYLQPVPGSDAAIAFAMMHVIERDGLCDDEFIATHTCGWQQLRAELPVCTPQWAERQSGVPATLIEQAAHCYGQGPSLLWLGQGLQRQHFGGNVMRACALLPAITGNIGKRGAGIGYLNGSESRGIDSDYLTAPNLRRGIERTISHMDLVDALADRERSRAFFCWNMNVVGSAPRQSALRAALRRDDLFCVVIDLFQTDTADFADIVLPAASFLEFDDLVVPYFFMQLAAQVKAENAPGDALPNQEIFRRLACVMGFSEPELMTSDQEMLDTLLQRSGLGIDWPKLSACGCIEPWTEPVLQFEGLRFPTPSGKIEIDSARAVADGHPSVPTPTVEATPRHRFRLLSPASQWQMNGSYGNDAQIRRQLGTASVTINPRDAQRLGVTAGDSVVLTNSEGRLPARVVVDAITTEGVLLCHKGRWPKLEDSGANINVLNPGTRTDMGASSAVHSIVVDIERSPTP
jgi:anaerobic selenocysteine-containing dehydrogenase